MKDTYLTCDYKITAIAILSLDSGSRFWYEWKANYIFVNIQGHFSGSELLKVTLCYAMEIVEPMLRNLIYVYVYKYLFQEASGLYRISVKEQLTLSQKRV